MRLTLSRHVEGLTARVEIDRPDGTERLDLLADPDNHHNLTSFVAPAEPHEFKARLVLAAKNEEEPLRFEMVEPDGHHH